MLRKTSIITAISLLTTPCFAGFYIGAGLGPEGAQFDQKSHVVRLVANGPLNIVDKEQFSGTGIFGTLFAGYGWKHDRFYLAGELNANLSSLKYQLINDEYINQTFSKTTFTIKNSEGVSLLPGYFLSDNTLFYGRIGYINGRLKIKQSDPSINSSTSNRNGIRYGLGIRHDITEQVTLMMDYSQINYDSIKSDTFDPFGGVRKTTKLYSNTAQVAFGLIYNFDAPKKVFVK